MVGHLDALAMTATNIPPPPPPPPLFLLSSLPSTSGNHHQHHPHSLQANLERLASTSTPIQARKQQLYSLTNTVSHSQLSQQQQRDTCSSPTSNNSSTSQTGQQQHFTSPSKFLQNELRRSRQCLSRATICPIEASCAPVEDQSSANPSRYRPPNGKLSSSSSGYQFQQHLPSSYQHRCNKHRLSRAPSATTTTHLKSVDGPRPSSSQLATSTTGNGTGTTHPSPVVFDGSKKSRCILFSQIYLIAHVSITLCLNEIRETTVDSASMITSTELLLDAYLAYILLVALVFFFLLRCYATPSELSERNYNELTEQSPVLFGATVLGLSQLTLTSINVMNCLETEFILLPLLKFAFSCFLMHFLLTQIIHSEYIGLRNIALAHLLATQISLWILSLSSETAYQEKLCNYTFDIAKFKLVPDSILRGNVSVSLANPKATATPSLEGLNGAFIILQTLLYILTHQFKLLTIFILITMWFTNNQSKINFIRAKLSDEEVIRSASFNTEGKFRVRGFAVGTVFLVLAIIAVLLPENELLFCSSTVAIQLLTTVISLSGLVIRRRKKYLNPKYQINVLKHHFIIFFTLFATFITCFIHLFILSQQLWSPATKSEVDSLVATLSIVSWITLLIQITLQTYLLRLQGKKLVDMSHIFALLVMANLSLWILDVSRELTSQGHLLGGGHTPPHPQDTIPAYLSSSVRLILTMFVALNRYYCALIFVHFWKMRF